jgi:glycosyltransferase involved in cell wall biosynthesis
MEILGTVIVPVFNGEEHIQSFINSFSSLIEKDSIEIIFVDNGSTDGTLQLLARFQSEEKSIQILRYTEKQSSYGARNHGALHAKGKWLIFTDIDCVAGNTYADAVQDICEQEGSSLISGPVNIFLSSGNLFELFDKEAYLNQDSYLANGYAATANLIVPKYIHLEAGGFDVFVSGADNLFCKKCAKLGWPIQRLDELEILHPARSSYEEHVKKAKRLGVGLAQFSLRQDGLKNKKLMQILRNIAGMVLPIHQIKIYNRIKKNKSVPRIRLFKFCFTIGFIQRLFIVKTLLFGVDDRLGNQP